MVHPTIFWAQNKEVIYMRIQVSSATDIDIKMEEKTFKFSCNSENSAYACNINLLHDIDPAASKFKNLTQSIEVLLSKKESQGFWDTLNEGGRLPYLRVDFDRWIDEDDEEKPKSAMPDMGNFGGMDFNNFDPSMFKMPEGAEGEAPEDVNEEEKKE